MTQKRSSSSCARARVPACCWLEPNSVAAAVVGIDAEALDPPARLLEAKLAGPQIAEHEAHDLAVHLRHLGGLGVAPQVVAHPLLPDLGAVDAGDALVDLDHAAEVELVERADAGTGGDSGHRRASPTRRSAAARVYQV